VDVELCTVEGKGFGIILLQEGDEPFADEATEIERGRGVVGAHDGAKLHGPFGEIGDLKSGSATVPKFSVFQDAMKLLADGRDGERIIDIDTDGADDFGGSTRPVLERMFDEVGERNDKTAQIPKPDDDVGSLDFLDPAPLAFDDDRVVDANGLRERDLKAGDDAGKGGTSGHADDQSGDSGGSEDAGAELSGVRERHEHDGDSDDNDHDDGDALDDQSLRTDTPGVKIVFHVDGVTESKKSADDLNGDDESPTDCGDEAEVHGFCDVGYGACRQRRERKREGKRDEREYVARGRLCVFEQQTLETAGLAFDKAL